jgi:hypothetical protein
MLYGMKYPHRIEAEYDVVEDHYWLKFVGAEGDILQVALTREQADTFTGMRSRDPAAMARDLYVSGHIDVEGFERRLERTLRSQ